MTEQNNDISNYEVEKMRSMTYILVAEYNILRKEIDIYHGHQQRFLNFILVLFTAMLAALGSLISQPQTAIEKFSYIFLLFPFIYTLLSLLYTDRTIRVIRIADYLHNYLRPKANELVGQNVFQWEIYKRLTTIFNKKIALMLDRVRWWIFIIPSIVAISFFLLLHDQSKWKAMELILLIIVSICVFLSFLVMYITDETLGIQSGPRHDLDGSSH